MRTAVYVGSFDPITKGHLDIIERASKMYDTVIVGLGVNASKKYLFSVKERLHLMRDAVKDLPNVKVHEYNVLTTLFCRVVGASVLIRGLRAVSDFDAEFAMCMTNLHIAPEIETIFMMPRPAYQFISSSMVRELARVDEEEYKPFVTKLVAEFLKIRSEEREHPNFPRKILVE